jgi:hypothetical protein
MGAIVRGPPGDLVARPAPVELKSELALVQIQLRDMAVTTAQAQPPIPLPVTLITVPVSIHLSYNVRKLKQFPLLKTSLQFDLFSSFCLFVCFFLFF